MDTMGAFLRGQMARERGDSMIYFDGVRIKKLMKEQGVTEAYIFLSGDRGYTETTVKINKKGNLTAEGMGVDGSIWATPILEIDGEEFDVGTKDKKRMIINFK